MKRALVIAVAVFIIYFVVTQPAAAGTAVRDVFVWLGGAADSLGVFLSKVVTGK